MPDNGKSIGLGFLVIMVALASAFVIPEFFGNLANQQDSTNSGMFQAIRIIIVIFVFLVLGGSMHVFVGGS